MTTQASEILDELFFKDDPGRRQQVVMQRVFFDVAEAVYAARAARGLTQHALAKHIGTSTSAVARVEEADYDSDSIKIVAKLAAAMHLRLLIEFRDDERQPLALNVKSEFPASRDDTQRGDHEPEDASQIDRSFAPVR